MTRKQRRRVKRGRAIKRNADLLLAFATAMIGFDGDFVNLAALMGWTCGPWWRENPAITLASKRFEARCRAT